MSVLAVTVNGEAVRRGLLLRGAPEAWTGNAGAPPGAPYSSGFQRSGGVTTMPTPGTVTT